MTVCKFYLQGFCKFGSNCRFEHPAHNSFQSQGVVRPSNFSTFGRQQSWSGGGSGPGNFQGGSSNFGTGRLQGRLGAPATATQGNKPAAQTSSIGDIMTGISEEMKLWQQSKMWPFSCFGYGRGVPCLPGLEDQSAEEVRLKAYKAKKSGDISTFTQWLTNLASEYTTMKQQLLQPDAALRGKLTFFIDNVMKNSNPDGSITKSNTNNSTNSLFGATAPSNSVFGGSSSGQTNSVFGGGAFGGSNQTNSQSVFGGGASSQGFGNSAATGGAAVGTQQAMNQFSFASSQAPGPAVGQGQGLFGKNSSQSVFGQSVAGGNSHTAFGSSSFPAAPASVFPAQSTAAPGQVGGVFGGGSQPASFPGAANQQAMATASTTATPFGSGQPLSSQTAAVGSNSVFGAGGAANTATATATTTNQFSFASSQPSATQQTAPSVGGGSGVLAQPMGLFGKPASASVFGGGGGTVSSAGANRDWYTPLDSLTDDERQQFQADRFTAGNIPLRPPPLELC